MSATEILAKLRSPTQEHSPVIKEIAETASCGWCDETKPPFNYVLPLADGEKLFCSKSCIAQYRKQYNKGKCTVCGNVIVANSPSKKFCSTLCENKVTAEVQCTTKSVAATIPDDEHQQQQRQTTANNSTNSPQPNISPTVGNVGILSQLAKYNNNNNVTNSNGNGIKEPIPEATAATATPSAATTPTMETKCSTSSSSRYQYETLQTFDWDSYLKVCFPGWVFLTRQWYIYHSFSVLFFAAST